MEKLKEKIEALAEAAKLANYHELTDEQNSKGERMSYLIFVEILRERKTPSTGIEESNIREKDRNVGKEEKKKKKKKETKGKRKEKQWGGGKKKVKKEIEKKKERKKERKKKEKEEKRRKKEKEEEEKKDKEKSKSWHKYD
ncbi:hypothetical protein HID67_11240, partial [Pasteurella multocida]|nr:hypothetical protein [Pasteurella multocida]